MQRKEILKTIIREFHTRKLPTLIKRKLSLPFDSGKIITVIGPRRAGKTYLLYQHILTLIEKGVKKEKILYFNFEDERLDFFSQPLDLILQAYRELYPGLDLEKCYFFFDEVQNAEGWERFVRRIYDTISKNIFITGSNSKLLSQEIATSLRGRTIKYELFPLNFYEFLKFKNFDFDVNIDFYDSQKKAILINLFKEYLYFGGFPEISFLEEELKIKTLQEYFEVMLYRDIVERYKIKDVFILKYFLKRLAENTGKFLSIHKIYNELKSQGIRVSKDTLYKYLEFAENVYFIELIKKHYRSLVKSELAEKKVYLIDSGMLSSIRHLGYEGKGILLETVIFKELFLFDSEVTCFKEKRECDFIVDQKIAIQ
ncbi:MAG: ATP-binding protein, partial [Thermodesulfobacteria bacterium]|nr:ATP-binding protein [Thermodesulfobacteriota bacterium]